MAKALRCVRAVKNPGFARILTIKNAVIRASVTPVVTVSLPLIEGSDVSVMTLPV